MKKDSYLVKTLAILFLLVSTALASDKNIKEKSAAKLDIIDVVKLLQNRYDGEIVKLNLKNNDSNLVYEAQIKEADDMVKNVIVDAGNGEILLSKARMDDYRNIWPWNEFPEYAD